MRNTSLKLINKISDNDLLKNILSWFRRSNIKFKNEDQMLQSVGVANIRMGMAQAHIFLESKTEEHRQLKKYLSLGQNHRILLDCFWLMQARGDENIIIGDTLITDSLAFAMKKMTNIGIDATKKIVNDGVSLSLFKRIKDNTDKRRYVYKINDSQNLIEAYIAWGNTNLGISGNLFSHELQGIWGKESQEAFFRKVGWWDNNESLLSIRQEIALNKYWGDGSIKSDQPHKNKKKKVKQT
jgi:hypothetical protein